MVRFKKHIGAHPASLVRMKVNIKQVGLSLLMLFVLVGVPPTAYAQSGCRTGATALGNAFVRSYSLYALYYGDLESYVASNRTHFVAEGDAIRCAKALSIALFQGSIQRYDETAFQRRQALNTQLQTLGISPGPAQPTASEWLFAMAQDLDRLARVLPPAAEGNYGPLRTASSDIERMRKYAEEMLTVLLQDPVVADVFRQLEPLIKETAELEYQILVGMANGLMR